MFQLQYLRKKTIILFLLITFLLSSHCTVYQNMRPTGEYTALGREKIKDEYGFRVVQMPEVKKPSLIVEFGKYPVYKEKRNIREAGISKTYSSQYVGVGLLSLAGGLAVIIYGLTTSPNEKYVTEEGDSASSRRAAFIGGGFLTVLGGVGLIIELSKKGKPASRYKLQSVLTEDKNEFESMPHSKIRIFSSTIEKNWELITDRNGHANLNVAEYAELVRDGSSLEITFESLENQQAINTFVIPSSFFADLKRYYASIRPPDLLTTVTYDERDSYTANKLIDGAEQAYLVTTIENRGEGKALDVKLQIDNSNPAVALPQVMEIGTIEPGQKVAKRIPLKAALNLIDGNAVVDIQTKEQRGYDAQPVKLELTTRHLDMPQFEWTRIEVNDANVGLAKGNGNGIPENGETVELKAYIKNVGVGKAYDVTLILTDQPSGLKVVQSSDKIGTLLPGESRSAKVVFKIPTTFTAKSIPLSLKVADALNADVSEKRETLSMGVNVPILAYELEKPGLIHNGGEFVIQLQPKNVGKLTAENVRMQVSSSDRITINGGSVTIGDIPPGAQSTPQIATVTIPRTYAKNSISLSVRLTQNNFEGFTRSEVIPIQLWEPRLEIAEQLRDANGNGQIEQGERVELTVTVSNTGQLTAKGVSLNLEAPDSRFNDRVVLGTIPPQGSESHTFVMNIPWGMNTGPFPIELTASQTDFTASSKSLPYEIVSGAAIVQQVGGQTEPSQPTLTGGVTRDQAPTISVVNLKEGDMIVERPYQVTITVGDDQQLNEVKLRLNGQVVLNSKTDPEAQKQLKANNKLLTVTPSLQNLMEGENVLEISAVDNANQVQTSTIRFEYHRGQAVAANVVLNPSIDIERDIPSSKRKNPDAVAVIFGIERYKDITGVTYARRDAAVFREYAVKVLGVPEERTYLAIDEDATGTEFRKVFLKGGWLDRRVSSNSDVYVYYAGHGAPDIEEKTPYLIPYDGDMNYPKLTGFSVKEMYNQLSSLAVRSITVFIDACFSGISRENKVLLADARRVIFEIENPVLSSEKIVSFSASSGVQISSSYPEKQHGLFTYFLLKGMKGEADANGDRKITVRELDEYLTTHVERTATAMDREQKPQVMALDENKVLVGY